MEVDKDWIETILLRRSHEKEVRKISEVEARPAVGKGENYMSVMTRVKFNVNLASGRKIQKSILIKEIPPNELTKAMIAGFGAYLKEITIYRDIIPLMEAIMEKNGDKSDPIWPKCLEYHCYDKLVFEDLSEKGFVMANRLQGLDLEHSKMAVKALAKFHALSVSLKENQLIPMEIFGENMFHKNNNMISDYNEKLFSHFVEFSERNWGVEWKPTFEKLKEKFIGKVGSLILNLTKRDDTKFCVLNHGDFWSNNMLFKYGFDTKDPVSIRLIDFQNVAYCTPAMDLQYFMNTTPSLEVRQSDNEAILKTYHRFLVEYMEKWDCKTTPPTFEELLGEMKRLDIFGLFMAVSIQPILFAETPEDAFDVDQALKNNEEGIQVENPVPINGKTYIKYMKFTLKYFESKGVF